MKTTWLGSRGIGFNREVAMVRKQMALSLLATASLLMVMPLGAQYPRVRDSAGVRIVENSAMASAPIAFRIDPRPTFSIGGLDTPSEIDEQAGITSARRLPDGRVITTERHRVRIWSPSGELLLTFGAEGEGPGESRRYSGVCLLPNGNIAVVSSTPPRIAVHAPNGTLRSTANLQVGPDASGCFADGSVARGRTFNAEGQDAPLKRYAQFHRISATGDTLGVLGTGLWGVWQRVGIFTNAAAQGEQFLIGAGVRPEFHIVDWNGALRQVIRTADPVRRVTAAEARKGGKGFIEAINVRGGRFLAGSEEGIPLGTWPSHGFLRFGSDQMIWVREPEFIEAPDWFAFTPTGELLGRLQSPREILGSATVKEFGAGEVILSWEDDDGARHLSIHRLIRVPPR
jgi:hypothetical protein